MTAEHERRADAVMAAIEESDPGDTVTIHGNACELRTEDDGTESAPCSCSPLVIAILSGADHSPRPIGFRMPGL